MKQRSKMWLNMPGFPPPPFPDANHTGTVSAQTQQRISEAIEALDFQLNSRRRFLRPEKQTPSQWCPGYF